MFRENVRKYMLINCKPVCMCNTSFDAVVYVG